MPLYQSTRDNSIHITSAEAISQGLSSEGGLFLPDTLPSISKTELKEMRRMDYPERAFFVLQKLLDDFPKETLRACVNAAYAPEKFGKNEENEGNPAPLAHLFEGRYILELWHGPTLAFKDMALQLLPHLLTEAGRLTGSKEEKIIPVATSGDTGKAALEGFKDVSGTRMLVFYPENGVSPLQKRQMITQEGENVCVCGVNGNFDDAQAAVKRLMSDDKLKARMKKHGKSFSSANSINWGRLAPQIAYYVSAYVDLIENEEITAGDIVNVCVPTGNFGNILAAYYAKQMGVPFGKLICASNQNNVLYDFITTGVYDKNRPFFTTESPSMDILISSNLERLLYELSGRDDESVRGWMEALAASGKYIMSAKVMEAINEHFAAGWCDDAETARTIKAVFDKYAYMTDPHTAVAVAVYEGYRAKTGDDKKVIIASTASPFKFADFVLTAVNLPNIQEDEEKLAKLSEVSGMKLPEGSKELFSKPVRFEQTAEKDALYEEAERFIFG